MNTYKPHTLGELITALQALPADAMVQGLGYSVDSYRGYYERNAIAPSPEIAVKAHDLAGGLVKEIDKPIHGWKGGEFLVDSGELVYLAAPGDIGPVIAGLTKNDAGNYEPVLIDTSRFW